VDEELDEEADDELVPELEDEPVVLPNKLLNNELAPATDMIFYPILDHLNMPSEW